MAAAAAVAGDGPRPRRRRGAGQEGEDRLRGVVRRGRRDEHPQDGARVQGLRRHDHAARRPPPCGRRWRPARPTPWSRLGSRRPTPPITGSSRTRSTSSARTSPAPRSAGRFRSTRDISSIEDLKTKASLVEGKVIGIDPGAGLMKASDKAIKEYGLPVKLVDGSRRHHDGGARRTPTTASSPSSSPPGRRTGCSPAGT